MVIVVIVLCVLIVGVTLFKILGVIDFINMDGYKKKKSKDNAKGNVTDAEDNELNK